MNRPRIVDGTGRVLMTPPSDAGVRMLRRATLHGVLLDAVAAEPGITAHFGSEAVAVGTDGVVMVRGLDMRGTTHAADLVIAADGARSRVRGELGFGATVTTGVEYLRALVEAPALNEEAWTAAGIFGSFDVDGGAYVYASAGTAATRAAVAAKDLCALRRAWAGAYPAGAPLLARIERWDRLLLDRVVRVRCDRWSDGRVALLGDAAHAMAPNLGQGANSALLDAAVLLDELRRAPSLSVALAAYEARRRPAVERVAALSARLGALAEETRAVPRWLRDRVLLPLANRLAGDPTPKVLQEPADALLAIGRA